MINTNKYDSRQLKIGTRVELEHTKSKKVAKKIASQHLDEFPHYYTYLLRMEKTMKKAEQKKK